MENFFCYTALMASYTELDSFLERVMHINVLTMGGASEGIIGSSSTGGVIINNLKKTAIAFAHEYRKPASNHDELMRLEQEIAGYLQTLQLTYTLSESEADRLIQKLQILTDKSSD